MRHSLSPAAVLASILVLICGSVTFAQFRFSVTPLGENLHRGRAVAINDSGAVAGLYGEEEVSQTFLWTAAGGVQLFPTPADATWARAADINNSGSVLVSDSTGRVGLWEGAALHELADLHRTGVNAINTQVQIVGSRYDSQGNTYAGFRWLNGAEQPLPLAGGREAYPIEINQAGDVVGAIDSNPTLWQADGTVRTLSQNGYAYDVNKFRWVVGADRGGLHAFVWTPTVGWQNMGVHPAADFDRASNALAVNDSGHAVGFAEINTQEDDRAFFWTADEGMLDLNALLDATGEGWVLELAMDINNSDQIVGFGKFNGEQRAFLLTPTQVPEAGTVIFGLAAVIFSHRQWAFRTAQAHQGRRASAN